MVGVSGRDIRAVVSWIGGLGLLRRLMLGGGVAIVAALTAWAVITAGQDARLVRADPDALPQDPALMRFAAGRGRGLFMNHCASCHGRDARGHYTLGVPNLTDADWLYGTGEVSDIETVVQYGIRDRNSRTWKLADMPAFAKPVPYAREPAIKPLSPSDITDMIQYLRFREGRPADRDAADRGAALYANRGGCYDCHGGDARGDASIGAPDLTDAVWLYGDGSDKWIYDSIAFGRGGVCPAWFNRLNAVQIRQLAVYVYSLSHGNAKPEPSAP
jgi:cbb3-type cytochrome c oxidase subunit III